MLEQLKQIIVLTDDSSYSHAARMIKIKTLATSCVAELTYAGMKSGFSSQDLGQPTPEKADGQALKPVGQRGTEKGNAAKEPTKTTPSKVIL